MISLTRKTRSPPESVQSLTTLCRHENSWLPGNEDKYTGPPLFTNTIKCSEGLHIPGTPWTHGSLPKGTASPCYKSSRLLVTRHHCCHAYTPVMTFRTRRNAVMIMQLLLV